MLRIRTGARHGLRGGVFGFVAAVFTISGDPSHAAPYADIVVDANSGTVLHSTNPDAQRHPASLTKIMTLYLLFEQLEAGKLKLDSQLPVSKEAASQMPTKLGLKPGSTLMVEDAIKGLVTRSANDAAVVVAEAIAGDEDTFARLMTRKAQALGMSRTIYKNASGLPDSAQITTARDQSTLGRAVQERFPRYYKYFSIRTFVYRGQSIGNHNHLLGRVEGVDGIKTGYVNASGFNLVTSVHRGNRYLVAVVMGGSSAGSRDAKMRDLISDKIAQASVKRTAPMVAEGSPPPAPQAEPKAVAKVETASEPKVAAKVEAKPEPKVAAKAEANKTEAKPEPKAEARFAVASAVSLPVRLSSAPAAQTDPATTRTESMAAVAQPRTAAGSTDPIRPVLVKTLSVKAGTQTASLAPMHVSAPAPSEPAPVVVAAPAAPAPVVAVKPEPPAPQPAPVVVAAAKPTPAPAAPPVAAKIEAPLPALVTASKPDVPAPALSFAPIAAKAEPAAPPAASPARVAAAEPAPAPARASAPAAKPQHRSGWIIQVGAFPAEQEAKKRLSSAQTKAAKLLTKAEAFTETVEKGGTTLYRARFAGLDKDSAEAACKYLKRNDVECVTIKN